MSKIAFSLVTPRDADIQFVLNVLDPEPGKSHYTGFLNESVNGKKLPGRPVTLFVSGSGDDRWFNLSSPILGQDDDGNPVLSARTNEKGEFINSTGRVVPDEKDAEQRYVYVTWGEPEPGSSEAPTLLYGPLGTINIKNMKADGKTPTKVTVASVKLYDHKESYHLASARFEMSDAEKGSPEYEARKQSLTALQKSMGKYVTGFIDKGHDFLREQGFPVRGTERNQSPAPQAAPSR